MSIKEHFTDASIAAAASKSTYTGAGLTVTGWLLSSQAAVAVGMVVGVLGLITNFVFKLREDRRQEKLLQEKLKKLKE
jgi:hypothetical protein